MDGAPTVRVRFVSRLESVPRLNPEALKRLWVLAMRRQIAIYFVCGFAFGIVVVAASLLI